MPRRRGQRGQTLVELVALLPAIVLVTLVGWQMAVAGYAWTVAGGAARAGARASEVGAPAPEAALATIPGRLGEGAEVAIVAGGADGRERVRVRLRIPRVLPLVPLPGRLSAEATVGIGAPSP
jgi:TadE-like protein